MIPNLTLDLKKLLKTELDQAARTAVADLLTQKLTSHGIETDEFPLEDLVDHIFAGSSDAFVWGEQDSDTTHVSLTSDDIASLEKRLDEVLQRSDVILHRAIEDSAKAVVRQLLRDWPEREAYNDALHYGFKKRLLLYWGKPLQLFHILVQCAEDILEDFEAALRRSRAKKGIVLREVLLSIQARTLRTSRAVLVLLANGLPDDAYARWRTLYELNVIATLIAAHGDEAARRYRDHEFVDLKRRLDNQLLWNAVSKREKRSVQRNYEAVLKRYGQDFRHPNAWAAPFVAGNNKRLTFRDIEKAAYDRHPVPPYKESSLQVHGARAGLMGLGSSDRQIAAGYSNVGLDIPLMHSSLALMQTTQLLLMSKPKKDPLLMQVVLTIDRRIDSATRKAARRLKRHELKERQAEATQGY